LPPPVAWVDVHPEITPPSNFHHFRDTTAKDARFDILMKKAKRGYE
jgi:hypothetical protein